MTRQTLQFFFDAKPADEPKKFTGIAYSGGVVPDYGWFGDAAVDLASLKNANGKVPVLIDHNRAIDQLAGHGQLSLDDGALLIDGSLTDVTETGRMVAGLLASGFPLQMSIGFAADAEELKAPQEINGRTMSVRTVFRNAEILEVSFVPVGADRNTAASAAFSHQEHQQMSRLPEDQELIDAQAAEITALKAQIGDLTTQVQAQATAARMAALSALFGELGRELPADAEPYLSMNEQAFSAYAADLRSVKPQIDPKLFSEQAVPGKNDKGAKELTADEFGALVEKYKAKFGVSTSEAFSVVKAGWRD